ENPFQATQLIRVETQRNHADTGKLGGGDFDLEERAYRQSRDETVVRGSVTGSIRKAMYNELRLQWRSQETTLASASHAPAVLVLNAFNAGGAQIDGAEHEATLYVADDLDLSKGRHALRVGLLFEDGRSESGVRRNAAGTFTFADLSAFGAGRPSTYRRNAA